VGRSKVAYLVEQALRANNVIVNHFLILSTSFQSFQIQADTSYLLFLLLAFRFQLSALSFKAFFRGEYRSRTDDLLLAKQAL
jgi:hypothetical protein